MWPDFARTGIDWEGDGYRGCPDSFPESTWPPSLQTVEWRTWTAILCEAKSGDFLRTPELFELHRRTSSPLLLRAAATLMGHAGSAACFEIVRREFHNGPTFEHTIDYCDILQSRGGLSDIPLIVEGYTRVSPLGDSGIIPVWLADLLEPDPDHGCFSEPLDYASLQEYSQAVLNRTTSLAAELGGPEVLVFRGKGFGVVSLARQMLANIGSRNDIVEMRRRFEAATGANCTAFFNADKVYQPLAAAQIVEEFLNSPGAGRYEEGRRYFFGHLLPY